MKKVFKTAYYNFQNLRKAEWEAEREVKFLLKRITKMKMKVRKCALVF